MVTVTPDNSMGVLRESRFGKSWGMTIEARETSPIELRIVEMVLICASDRRGALLV